MVSIAARFRLEKTLIEYFILLDVLLILVLQESMGSSWVDLLSVTLASHVKGLSSQWLPAFMDFSSKLSHSPSLSVQISKLPETNALHALIGHKIPQQLLYLV